MLISDNTARNPILPKNTKFAEQIEITNFDELKEKNNDL